MGFPIIMHVNYCEQGQSLEDICRKAVAWGYDGVEFRRKRYNVEEGVVEYLDALAAAVEKSGLKQVLFGGPGADLMQTDEAVRAAEVATLQGFFRLATERFTLSVCNTMTGPLQNPNEPYVDYSKHGSAVASDEHYRNAAEGFRRLGDMAGEMGFKFAFEVHMGYLHDLPASTRRLLDAIDRPAVGANLDFGNVVYFRERPTLAESIALLADKLYYVHWKNSVPVGERRIPAGLSEGEINHREYLRLLIAHGYKGPLCVEAPRPGDRECFAQQDIAYVRGLVEGCGVK